jgi:hypothetical protein
MQALPFPSKSLGYAQFAAGGVDASTLVSTATFGGQPGAGIPPGTTHLLITPAAQAIRWRDDGTAPTTAVGYPLAVAAELIYSGSNMGNLRLISQVAGAVVNIVAFGSGPF